MTTFIFTNDATSNLAGAMTSSATTMTLTTGTGSLFPAPSGSQQFPITMLDAATQLLTEIMYCTARTGDVLTVVRGQESTTALSWLAGDGVSHNLTAGTINTFAQGAIGATFIPYDISGGVAGTMTANQVVLQYVAVRACQFPPNNLSPLNSFTGSRGGALTAFTSANTFNIQKNGTTVGTMHFNAGASSASFTGGSLVSLAAGDLLSVIAPSGVDATGANLFFTLAGSA